MGALTQLTSGDNFFEDFAVGQTIRHARGKTITNLENVNFTNMVMNTAQGHFNEHLMSKTPLGQVISYGGVNFSIVLGLASQDTIENALAELGLDKIALKAPVVHGDTIYAYSRVLETREADREDAGVVVFQHWGLNQNDTLVAELQRTALIKRRSHWGDR
ncbi:MAG: MaoC family dehydratase [Caulobacterales bacterium]|nr:MaoC family dehydratase [Caulobacterales bacterium]